MKARAIYQKVDDMRTIDHLQPPFEALLQDIVRDAFAIVDPDFVNALTQGLVLLELAPGERLFRQGDTSNDVYFLLNGRLRALVEDGLDAPRELGEVMRGETVGELAFISGEPRMASVIAVRGSLVAKLDREHLGSAIGGRPQVALAVMRTVVARFRQAAQKRPAPRRPVTICLIPITQHIEIDGLATDICRHLAAYGDRVGNLSSCDATTRFGRESVEVHDSRSDVSRWLDDFEAAHTLSIFIADPLATAWSRHCVAHADEIVLVASADAPASFSAVEQDLFGDQEAGVHPRQTLLLVHKHETRSPAGTAAWLAARNVERHIHVRLDDEMHMKRLGRLLSGRGVGVVLSGGGARGFAHIGAFRALSEAGVEADVIGGASIGSVVGAWQSMGVRDDALVEAARRAFVDAGNPVGDYNAFPFVSLVSGRKVRRLTEQAIRDVAGIDVDVEDTWVTFFCIAANFSTSEEAVLSRGLLSKALLASFAIPGILPPIVVDGHLHVDGGAVNNLPVDVIERYGLSKIIAVDLLAGKISTVDYDWVPTTSALAFHKMRGRTLAQLSVPPITELLLRSGILNAVKRQREMRERADLCIAPSLAGIGFLDWKKYRDAIEGGAEAARASLATMSAEDVSGYR